MALIKCPECGKEISDKAKVCIHCGYPISEIIEQQNHNNGFFKIRLINCFNKKPNAIMHVRAITGLDIKKAKALVDLNQPVIISGLTYDDANTIKKIFNNDDIEISIEEDNESTEQTIINIKEDKPKVKIYTQPQQPQPQNIPKCPTCGSTNLKKISTTSKAINTGLFGLLGNKRKMQFHCNNCGYEW